MSSQVNSGERARLLWGARRRERSGGRGAAQLACSGMWLPEMWLDSPDPGLYQGFISTHLIFVFFLIFVCHFQEVLSMNRVNDMVNERPIQADADDGCDRGKSGAWERGVPVRGGPRCWSRSHRT